MKLDLSNHIDIQRAETYLKKLIEEGSKIELKKFVKKRTLAQNGYLHVCLTIFSQETGFTVNELKDIFAERLPDILTYTKSGHVFRKSTSDLTTKEMTELIDLIRSTANENLGVYIPTSEEYLTNKFEIDRQYGI